MSAEKVHFASLMDLCHLKNSELEPQFQKYKGRVVLRGAKSECPDIWIRLPQHKWPKSWSSMEDPVLPLKRNLNGQHSGLTVVGRAIRECFFERRSGKSSKLGMFMR